MRTLRLLVALVAVLALAAGCGDDGGDDEVDAGGDPAAPTSTTADPETPVSSPATSTTTGDTVPGTTWTRIEPTDDLVDPVVATPDEIVPDPEDPNAVLVRFYGGVQECYGAQARVFGEDDTVVRILLEVGGNPDAGDTACIEIAEAQELQLVLDSPVGDRQLLAADAADEGGVD